MTWAKFSDDFNNHPKIIKAGPLAVALYQRAVIHCCRYLTDGAISRVELESLIDWAVDGVDVSDAYLIDKLVGVGLLDQDGADDFIVHDFTDWNPSREEVVETRTKRSRAGSRGGKQSASKRQAKLKQNSSKTQANENGLLDTCLPFASDMVEAKSNPEPEPEPEPVLYIYSGDQILSTEDAEAAGYRAFGALTGANIPKIGRLLPITKREWSDAMTASDGKSWAYLAKVIESHREVTAQGDAPRASPPDRVEYIRSHGVPNFNPGIPGSGIYNPDEIALARKLSDEWKDLYGEKSA